MNAIGVAPPTGQTRAERRLANQKANAERQALLNASTLARVCAPARDYTDSTVITVRPRARRSVRKRHKAADALADALYSQVQPDDIQRVAQVALDQALKGDAKAREWLTSTLIGSYSERVRAQHDEANGAKVNLWALVHDQAAQLPEAARKAVENMAKETTLPRPRSYRDEVSARAAHASDHTQMHGGREHGERRDPGGKKRGAVRG